MFTKSQKNMVTIAVLFAFMALITGIFVAQHMDKKNKHNDMSQFHGTLLQTPRDVNPFSFQSTDNQHFNNQRLIGSWTLVFFGFTHCGYLCPTTMAEIGKMYRILVQQKTKPLPKVVMISIDPNRDSLEILKNYVQAFDPSFLGARGESEAVKKMALEMGIAYSKITSSTTTAHSSDDYDIQHSGALILFNPKGELNAFFTTPHHAELLAKDYQLLVN